MLLSIHDIDNAALVFHTQSLLPTLPLYLLLPLLFLLLLLLLLLSLSRTKNDAAFKDDQQTQCRLLTAASC